jgi:hypothetical protein
MESDRLPEGPGTPLRALIARSYLYMARRPDGSGWEGAENLVREAYQLGRASALTSSSPSEPSPGGACPHCGGARYVMNINGRKSRCQVCRGTRRGSNG